MLSTTKINQLAGFLVRNPNITQLAILIIALFAIYWEILSRMVSHWKADPNYSHGFLIVPLAIHFAWSKKSKLRKVPISYSAWGIPFLIMGAITLTIGTLGIELMNMRSSFLLTLIGLVIMFLGKDAFRILSFPLFFLFLMIPLPGSILNIITFPLQLFAAKTAVSFLHFLHIPVFLEGNVIHLPETDLFVAEACSGLRSVMALITLGIVFSAFFAKKIRKKIILILSTIPIAILINSFRVALTAMLAYWISKKTAEGVIHETQGIFTFGIAFLILLLEAKLLDRLWPEGKKLLRTK